MTSRQRVCDVPPEIVLYKTCLMLGGQDRHFLCGVANSDVSVSNAVSRGDKDRSRIHLLKDSDLITKILPMYSALFRFTFYFKIGFKSVGMAASLLYLAVILLFVAIEFTANLFEKTNNTTATLLHYISCMWEVKPV